MKIPNVKTTLTISSISKPKPVACGFVERKQASKTATRWRLIICKAARRKTEKGTLLTWRMFKIPETTKRYTAIAANDTIKLEITAVLTAPSFPRATNRVAQKGNK